MSNEGYLMTEEDYAECWKQYFEKKVEESNVK